MIENKITFDLFVRGLLVAILIVGVFMLVRYLSAVLLPFFH